MTAPGDSGAAVPQFHFLQLTFCHLLPENRTLHRRVRSAGRSSVSVPAQIPLGAWKQRFPAAGNIFQAEERVNLTLPKRQILNSSLKLKQRCCHTPSRDAPCQQSPHGTRLARFQLSRLSFKDIKSHRMEALPREGIKLLPKFAWDQTEPCIQKGRRKFPPHRENTNPRQQSQNRRE